jgi:3-hydroxybutyryl-CoA dehydrogenase
MEVKVFGVVGAGQMGNGIAQVAAASGLDVIMTDIKDEFVQKGLGTIEANLERGVVKGRLAAEDKAAILGRIRIGTDLKELAAADYVVEAATEREDLKFGIFRDLDAICPPATILATNTSSIPIGRIAAQTKRPEQVIGMHFMNPVPVMKLVEIIRGLATSDTTFDLTWELVRKIWQNPGPSQ